MPSRAEVMRTETENSYYYDQLVAHGNEIDLGFWKSPEGIKVAFDTLDFVLVPDQAESMMSFEVAKKIHLYQQLYRGTDLEIKKAILVTMGGLLPGSYLYDHLAWMEKGRLAFDFYGLASYTDLGERLSEPNEVQDLATDIEGQMVLAVDDLGDSGGTMVVVKQKMLERQAAGVLTCELYSKPEAQINSPADFSFGEVSRGTWLITPREVVETLLKRVPVWRENGALEEECERNLYMIGYDEAIVEYYLPQAYQLPVGFWMKNED